MKPGTIRASAYCARPVGQLTRIVPIGSDRNRGVVLFSCLKFREDRLAPGVIRTAYLGKPHIAGGPLQQAHAKPILQPTDMTADARFREVQRPRGSRKSALLNDRRKEQKIIEVVHALILAPGRHCSPATRLSHLLASFPSQVVPWLEQHVVQSSASERSRCPHFP